MRTVTQRDLESLVAKLRELAQEEYNTARTRKPTGVRAANHYGRGEGLDRAAELVESFYNV